MAKIPAGEPAIVAERVEPILDLGESVRGFWQDVMVLRTQKLVMASAAEIADTARRLKGLPYVSGAFPELLEVVARAFEAPNNPERYTRAICAYLADALQAAAGKPDITPAYVTAKADELRSLAMGRGIEMSIDYV